MTFAIDDDLQPVDTIWSESREFPQVGRWNCWEPKKESLAFSSSSSWPPRRLIQKTWQLESSDFRCPAIHPNSQSPLNQSSPSHQLRTTPNCSESSTDTLASRSALSSTVERTTKHHQNRAHPPAAKTKSSWTLTFRRLPSCRRAMSKRAGQPGALDCPYRCFPLNNYYGGTEYLLLFQSHGSR